MNMPSILVKIALLFKQVIVVLVQGFRKIICIGRKRKTLTEDADPVSVVVIPSIPSTSPSSDYLVSSSPPPCPAYPSYNDASEELQMEGWGDWNSRGDTPTLEPTTIYSSHVPDSKEGETSNAECCSLIQAKKSSSSFVPINKVNPEPEMDFFKDMEPTVKVKKVLVRKKSASSSTSNRLAMDQDLEFQVSGELDEWKDEEGWSGEDSDQLDIDEAEILREAQKQRKMERQLRAKQQRIQKSSKSHDKLGLKVS